jgi:type IV pilus assembly protein PilX
MKKPIFKKQYKQSGFVLATSLIFLVIMTLLAVTAIRRSTLDEKVSGNLREQNLAFQAAEMALRFCQQQYETNPAFPILDAGLDAMPNEWALDANWIAGSGKTTTLPDGAVENVLEQPQCMIERWRLQGPKDDVGVKQGADETNKGLVHLITARGVGSTNNAVVWLQVTLRDGSL